KLLDRGEGQILLLTPYFAWTSGAESKPGVDWQDRSLAGYNLDWTGRSLTINQGFRQIGEEYSPAVGFTDQQGYRGHYLWVEYAHTPAIPHTRQLRQAAEFNYRTDLHNRLTEGITWLSPWWQDFDSGDQIDNWEYIESF